MERLDGKRIIITGGASGMGRTTVENFPALGAKVVFFYVNDKDGEEVAKISGAKYIHVDVSNQEEVEKGFKEAVEYLGSLFTAQARVQSPHGVALLQRCLCPIILE